MSFIEKKFSEPLHPLVEKYFTTHRVIESWSRKHTRAYHEEAISWLIEHAYKSNDFYRKKFSEKGIRPEDFRSLEDIKKFPFMTKDELRGKPFVLLSVPREKISQVHLSTGTTGGEHIYMVYAWEDFFINFLGPDMPQLMPLSVDDIVINALPHEMSLAGLGYYNLLQKGVGVLMVPAGKGGLYSTPQNTLAMARDLEATVLVTTPPYAAYLAEIAEEEGIRLGRDIKLRFMWLTGEGCSPSFRNRVEKNWGCSALFYYGSLEAGPMAIECQKKGGYHICNGHVFMEVVDRKTGEPVPPGEMGIIVVTELTRWASPLIRYQTGDIGFIDDKRCECGLELPRMGLRGRTEDHVLIQEKVYSPYFIEELLMQVAEVGNWYQLVPQGEKLLVRAELMPGVKPSKEVEEKIQEQLLKKAGIPSEVNFVTGLPRPGGKTARVVKE
ncbi:MAG: AMP-binding protein [Deltaproteobacteria bacterium]|nr:AMP-binding protein [Deltaproteobacteria bacterium]